MKNLARSVAVLAMIAAFAAPAGAAPSLEEVENAIVTAWDSYQSVACKADLAVLLNLDGQSVPGSGGGHLRFMRHEGKNLARLDLAGALTVPIGDTPVNIPQQVTTVFDGGIVNMLTEVLRVPVVMRHDASLEGGVKDAPMRALFKSLHSECNVRLVGTENLQDAPVHVIEAAIKKPDPDTPLPVSVFRFYFDENSKVLLRVWAGNGAGRQIGLLNFSEVQINPDIAAAAFQFAVPENAQMFDFEDAGSVLLPGIGL